MNDLTFLLILACHLYDKINNIYIYIYTCMYVCIHMGSIQ